MDHISNYSIPIAFIEVKNGNIEIFMNHDGMYSQAKSIIDHQYQKILDGTYVMYDNLNFIKIL